MTNANFNYWYNEIADIPEYVNGEWVDLETGLPFLQKRTFAKVNKSEIELKYAKSTAASLKYYVSEFVGSLEYGINKWSDNANIDTTMSQNLVSEHEEMSKKRITKAQMIAFIGKVSESDRYLNNQIVELNK